MIDELIEVKLIRQEVSNRCPDFDEDCEEVKDFSACFCGNERLPMADGYCPMLFKNTQPLS